MSTNTLSDRIVNSSNDLNEKFLAHPFLSEMLLKGEVSNGRQVLTRYYKFYKDTSDDWDKLFASGLKQAKSSEEAKFLEQMSAMFSILFQRFDTIFKAKFTDFDQTVMSKRALQDVFPSFKSKFDKAVNAPLLDILVSLLSSTYHARLYADLKFDPKYKPNWFYDFFVFDYNQCVGIVSALKSLIDNRGVGISEHEEQRLSQLFRRIMEIQIKLIDTLWTGEAK